MLRVLAGQPRETLRLGTAGTTFWACDGQAHCSRATVTLPGPCSTILVSAPWANLHPGSHPASRLLPLSTSPALSGASSPAREDGRSASQFQEGLRDREQQWLSSCYVDRHLPRTTFHSLLRLSLSSCGQVSNAPAKSLRRVVGETDAAEGQSQDKCLTRLLAGLSLSGQLPRGLWPRSYL